MRINGQTRRRLVAVAAATAAVVLAPLSARAADTGSVGARVVAGVAPCITINSPSNNALVDFGSLPFSATPGSSQAPGSPDITIANCATASESLLASGTNATAANATWTLSAGLPNQCSNNLNVYRLALRDANQADLFLTTNNQTVGTLGTAIPGSTITRTPRITMPCSGSGGNGQTMSMSYNFTATIP
jgi:hypothetical protein